MNEPFITPISQDGDEITIQLSQPARDVCIHALEMYAQNGISIRTAIRRSFDQIIVEMDGLPVRKWRTTHKEQWKALHTILTLYVRDMLAKTEKDYGVQTPSDES